MKKEVVTCDQCLKDIPNQSEYVLSRGAMCYGSPRQFCSMDCLDEFFWPVKGEKNVRCYGCQKDIEGERLTLYGHPCFTRPLTFCDRICLTTALESLEGHYVVSTKEFALTAIARDDAEQEILVKAMTRIHDLHQGRWASNLKGLQEEFPRLIITQDRPALLVLTLAEGAPSPMHYDKEPEIPEVSPTAKWEDFKAQVEVTLDDGEVLDHKPIQEEKKEKRGYEFL